MKEPRPGRRSALIELCRREPKQCATVSDGNTVPPVLDERRYRALDAVNRSVNRAIVAASDLELHGKADLWSVNPSAGDCEDYALTQATAANLGWLAGLGAPDRGCS